MTTKFTLDYLIEDLQKFRANMDDPTFLVDLAEEATIEQQRNLMLWVYKQFSPPELRLDPDSLNIEVRPFNEEEVALSEPLRTLVLAAEDELGDFAPLSNAASLQIIKELSRDAANAKA